MRKLLGAFLLAIMALAGPVRAESKSLVVVELFTSQGCSLCPPADAMLAELSKMADVLPLSLHVDYWDYIGWADSFGSAQFTERQKRYAQVGKRRSIYTPQMIVGGQDPVVGTKPMQVARLIDEHLEKPILAALTVTRQGDVIAIDIEPQTTGLGSSDVFLVRFIPEASVAIKRGENRGKTISYTNIVTQWQRLGVWSGGKAAKVTAQVTGDEEIAVLVQDSSNLKILAAALLD
ncbi:MAG: DUF1223 domain-containing protein [Mangrovicoccus sp.]